MGGPGDATAGSHSMLERDRWGCFRAPDATEPVDVLAMDDLALYERGAVLEEVSERLIDPLDGSLAGRP